jgi:hypothetical protein
MVAEERVTLGWPFPDVRPSAVPLARRHCRAGFQRQRRRRYGRPVHGAGAERRAWSGCVDRDPRPAVGDALRHWGRRC